MTAAQMRIADTIDAFYGEAGTGDGVSRSYKQAVEDLDSETIKALDGPYRYFFFFFLFRHNERQICLHGTKKKKKKGYRSRSHHAFLCLLPRHQRVHQKAEPQDDRL